MHMQNRYAKPSGGDSWKNQPYNATRLSEGDYEIAFGNLTHRTKDF